MKILVLIKQVPDPDYDLVIDSATRRIRFAGRPAYKMNRYDEFALEEALQIRQTLPDTTVTAIALGPERAADVLRRAIGMGADRGVLLLHRSEPDADPAEVAAGVAEQVRPAGFDLILAGAISEDEMNAVVGPMLACRLGWPWTTNVVAQRIDPSKQHIRVEREIEGGGRELLEIPLPAVLTVQSGINRPRYPTLSNMLRADRQPLDTVRIDADGLSLGRVRLVSAEYPANARNGIYLAGSLQDKAAQLARLIRQRAF